jgi:hypothetical protein
VAHRVLSILRRRLYTFLTILSLLLCLATVAFWVRSYWRDDILMLYSVDAEVPQRREITSNFGKLTISVERVRAEFALNWPRHGWRYALDKASKIFNFETSFLGFGYYYRNIRPAVYYLHRVVIIPHWFLALLFAILPALRLRSILRTRRQNRIGLCQHCGYDLRASPDRCPECGHASSSETVAS